MAESTLKSVTGWTILGSHGLVLAVIARDPHATRPAIANAVGITERQVGRVVKDLAAAGILRTERHGRNGMAYNVELQAPLRHPLLRDFTVGALLAFLADGSHRGPMTPSG